MNNLSVLKRAALFFVKSSLLGLYLGIRFIEEHVECVECVECLERGSAA